MLQMPEAALSCPLCLAWLYNSESTLKLCVKKQLALRLINSVPKSVSVIC